MEEGTGTIIVVDDPALPENEKPSRESGTAFC
jgi:hypothetical protein